MRGFMSYCAPLGSVAIDVIDEGFDAVRPHDWLASMMGEGDGDSRRFRIITSPGTGDEAGLRRTAHGEVPSANEVAQVDSERDDKVGVARDIDEGAVALEVDLLTGEHAFQRFPDFSS